MTDNLKRVARTAIALHGQGMTADQIVATVIELESILAEEESLTISPEYYWDGDRNDPYVYAVRGEEAYRFLWHSGTWSRLGMTPEELKGTFLLSQDNVPTMHLGQRFNPLIKKG